MIDADPATIIEDNLENAEGEDFGNGNASDYGLDESYDSIGAESRRPTDEEGNIIKPATKPKKDSSNQKPVKIGEATTDEKKEKKGIFRGIFGKKDKNNSQSNDY